MADPTDGELLDRCRADDQEAWRALVERYGPLILSVPRRYGLRPERAEDVFAEVCLALVRSLGAIRDAQALPQWLIRTATRATWEASRKDRAAAPPEDLPPLTGAAPPEELITAVEEEHLVRVALGRISERCRDLLTLLYFTDPSPSYDEVARQLKVPRGSLGPTRGRCLEKLREHLSPSLGGEVSGRPGPPPKG